jgi:hypothetical protein
MIASQKSDFNKGDKWPDLEVTKWPIEEWIQEPMQSDGYVMSLLYDPTLGACYI